MSELDLPDALDAEVALPKISTTEWSNALPANEYTLRAAILTCSERLNAEIGLHRADNRMLLAYREKSGWLIDKAQIGHLIDSRAVRPGSRYTTRPLRFTLLNHLFKRWDGAFFDEQETERIMRAFLSGAAPPAFMTWVKVDRG